MFGSRITLVIDHAVAKWYRVVNNQVIHVSSGGKYQVSSNSLSLTDFQSSDQGRFLNSQWRRKLKSLIIHTDLIPRGAFNNFINLANVWVTATSTLTILRIANVILFSGVFVAQLPGRGLFFWSVRGLKLPTNRISLYGMCCIL